jgi:hypothetical protein
MVNGFSIGSSWGSLIPAAGTKPGVVSEGDESIINQQLTPTRKTGGGYPIIGFASGECTFTRVTPDGQRKGSPFDRVVEDCVATAVLPMGSLTAQGVITTKAGEPLATTMGLTSGTGKYEGARGIVEVTFGKHFDTYTFQFQ